MKPGRRSLLFFLLLLPMALPARAQKLDKDDKKFLDDVRPILLPDEEKTYKGLKDKADRQEFQKIFWARRDPNLETPVNEFEVEYDKQRAEADALYKVAGRPGSQNDCGRMFILMGKPDEVKKESASQNPGLRVPETWTYRDHPAVGDRPRLTFSGGEALYSLDSECRLPTQAKLTEQLDRLAALLIVHPNIDYRVSKDGKLTKLADLLPKPSPARTLLKDPRQDFPLQSQAMFLKVQDGGTAVLGVVRAEAAALPSEDVGGRKVVKIVVAASAADASGQEAASVERKTTAEVQKDGSFAAAFRMSLRPGKYTLKAALTDEKGGKGSVASSSIEVPDYATGELAMASLMILRDVHDLPGGSADPDAPFAAFQLGQAELVPFGTYNLSKADAPWFFYQVYDLKVDEATGKASGLASLTVLKGGQTVVAQAPPQPLDTPVAGSAVGPVSFEKYEPGQYKVLLKITDNVAKKDKVQEISIEVKP